MATYDLKYPGAAIDAILDTAYDLQNAGYIFKGSATAYSGTPTQRTWLLAPAGFSGYGFSSAIPKGSIGICKWNGNAWSGDVINVVTIDNYPTYGSTNAVTSGGMWNALDDLGDGIWATLQSFVIQDGTASANQGTQIKFDVKMTDGQQVQHLISSFGILAATTTKAGLMSAADKAKVDAFLDNLRSLSFTDTTPGADVDTKIVETLKMTVDGVQEAVTALTILAATTSKAGLMSATDKAYIDGLPTSLSTISTSISKLLAMLGYYECSTAAGTAAKTVSASGYVLTNGGCIRIKMTNANTANNVTLNINSTGAKALYYDGAQASSSNSWDAGDILEVFYDGTQYQCASGGGGKFATGEKVKDTSITDEITPNSDDLPTSGAVAEETDNLKANIGYFTCDTAAATAAKVVAATGYKLTTGGNIRIKMANANTANNATLNINSTGAKALYFNGSQASSSNSWAEGEILIVYYDGTQYICKSENVKAENVSYDNSYSALESNNAQGAIDELVEITGMDSPYSFSAELDKYTNILLPIRSGRSYRITVTLNEDAVKNEGILMSASNSDTITGTYSYMGSIAEGTRTLTFMLDVTDSNKNKKYLKGNKWGANYNVSIRMETLSKIKLNTGEEVGELELKNSVSEIPINISNWSVDLLSSRAIGIPNWTWVNGKAFTTSGTESAAGYASYCKFNAKAGDVLKVRLWDSPASGSALLIIHADNTYNAALTYKHTLDWIEYYYVFQKDCEAYINIRNTNADGAEILIRSREAIALISDTIATRSDKTIYIAASNSSDKDKFYSDFVCTGTNDEMILHKALSIIYGAKPKIGGTIILRTGDYYFDSIITQNTFIYIDFGTTFGDLGIEIKGEHPAMSLNDEEVAGACIHITQTAYDSFNTTDTYNVFKILGVNWKQKIIFNELTIKCYWNQRKIVGIDLSGYTGAVKILNTQLYCFDNYPNHGKVSIGNPPALAVDGNIGIKMSCINSPNGTYGNNYENVSVSGFYEGFAVAGEHVYMRMCAAFFCNYGYTFQRYGPSGNASGNNEHTTVLIKCADERNKCLPKFFNKRFGNDYGQGIVMLGFTFEHASNIVAGGAEQGTLACEKVPGNFCGEITYTLGGFGSMNVGNTVDRPFWEHGHGQRFKTRNLCHDLACPTSIRNSYAPNYLQHIFDTTLNKEVICVETPSFAKVELTITGLANSNGNLSITLGSKSYSVTLSDYSYATTEELAAAIAYLYRMSKVNCYNNGNVIHFDDTYLGSLSEVSFNGGTTGITGTIEVVTNGTDAVWVDTMGNNV